MGRAQIFYQNKQWEKALNDYNQVVSNAPDSGLGYIGIADCMAALGNTKAAKKAYAKAREVDQGVAEVSIEKTAKLMYNMQDYDSALQEYEKVINIQYYL